MTAARYLRILSAVELMSHLGNDGEVRRLLSGVDPIEVRELAAELERDEPTKIVQLRLLSVGRFHPESVRV